ncbi:uncharacterized protein K452DRAFT_329736 [Aplosporella prunicola CBS 121167]|uniref:C2H2-type domain-containing protein n=1 Tax=Aplosporella prunicola CBS 121167 TaxID=1176127 RepID=A0A6A6AXA2_9PEZI|nr:uncharacterized protein K452DRAFT_329736 [Aplosporella prunicola CBS 121167]KAF2136380.1 hypothetical protein K452DRAFT_329736 [Aplosporella prunicola CBS 121167]
MDDTNHWAPIFECETCTSQFRSQNAANQHMNALGHWAPSFPCETCGKMFRTQGAANQHMNKLGHWAPRVPCETCGLKFFTQNAANDHMKAEGHYENYCEACDISFQNGNNLRMHLNSKVHRSGIKCPFCSSKYTTASGLIHHLERNSCPRAPQLNRETIHRMVSQRDPHGAITNKQIGWHAEENTTYTVTDRAFNGIAWECYLCHKLFSTCNALNSHANSPVHQQKVYHCPSPKSRCGKQFSTLAALFNHLESETCGFMRFEKVQQQFGNLLQRGRIITF